VALEGALGVVWIFPSGSFPSTEGPPAAGPSSHKTCRSGEARCFLTARSASTSPGNHRTARSRNQTRDPRRLHDGTQTRKRGVRGWTYYIRSRNSALDVFSPHDGVAVRGVERRPVMRRQPGAARGEHIGLAEAGTARLRSSGEERPYRIRNRALRQERQRAADSGGVGAGGRAARNRYRLVRTICESNPHPASGYAAVG
jgi:hypothetical protein